ncbi:hypothetical protein QSV34_14755 [Porticoccus sp. W117]|uniref:hypothetical protein n=1 Tax=Porticoccus sp. W117 TaxID=3054777 RepID=UPI0025965F08|nr:hypothetical protein [Porticoccus sp. W117]MDM3872611.1 hypothetical protein [Porticoccus sp. W117]
MDWVGDAINGSNGQPLTTYRTITAMDERGNVTHETRKGDNPKRGHPKRGQIYFLKNRLGYSWKFTIQRLTSHLLGDCF